MKRYRCHKEVEAAKIDHIDRCSSTHLVLTFEDGSAHTITQEWFDTHKPVSGGYFVRYADGYESFSPAKAFEEGYTPI